MQVALVQTPFDGERSNGEFSVLHLRNRTYVVRPHNQCGTMGFYPRAWTAVYLTAGSHEEALRKGKDRVFCQPQPQA